MVKVDVGVEGIEHGFLRGAVATLRPILIEVNGEFTRLATEAPALLRSAGYVVS